MRKVSFLSKISDDEFSSGERGDIEEVGSLEVGGEFFVVGPSRVHVDGDGSALRLAILHNEGTLKAIEATAMFASHL